MAAMAAAAAILCAAPANALVLCAKGKAGVVKEGAPIEIRTACTRKEVQVDPDAMGLRGPQGPQGPEGPQGAPGMNGAPGVADVEVVVQDGPRIINNQVGRASATASCPLGKKVLGGGISYVFFGSIIQTPTEVTSLPITTEPQGWTVSALAQNGDDWGVTAYAICAAVAP